jgi:hypothetical protein
MRRSRSLQKAKSTSTLRRLNYIFFTHALERRMPQKPVGGLATELRIDQTTGLTQRALRGLLRAAIIGCLRTRRGARHTNIARLSSSEQACEVYDLAILAASLVHPIKLSILFLAQPTTAGRAF